MPSERSRLMMSVMGSKREPRHDFRRKVGIMSREHEALEGFRIDIFTSSVVAAEKAESEGGTSGGSTFGEAVRLEENAKQSFVIF